MNDKTSVPYWGTQPHTFRNSIKAAIEDIESKLKVIRRAIEQDPDNLELYMEWEHLELTLADLNRCRVI